METIILISLLNPVKFFSKTPDTCLLTFIILQGTICKPMNLHHHFIIPWINLQRTSNPHCNGEPAREGSLVVCQPLQNRPRSIFCYNNETNWPEIKNKLLIIAQNMTILSSTTCADCNYYPCYSSDYTANTKIFTTFHSVVFWLQLGRLH